jgi:2-isopropylmalate synthase
MPARPTDDPNARIYDWNRVDAPPVPPHAVEFDDETLRDGIQSPSVRAPSIEEKKRLLHLMVDLGIQAVDIGLPGAGGAVREDVVTLAREIAGHRLPIAPNCAARTLEVDIIPVVEAAERSGLPIEASLFIGSSPIRQYVEGWTVEDMQRLTEKAVSFAVGHGLSVMFVTEDTTRAHPDALRALYTTAIAAGARRVCVADTVGHATPHGAAQTVAFIRRVADESGEDVKVDWHGHRDRALALENAIAAVFAGADRVHGTALGIGERTGNTPMEHLLVNFRLLGLIQNDLSKLIDYCTLASQMCEVPIAFNHPVIGKDAYRTSTGVHAAAVIKAMRKGDRDIADLVYSGVPAVWTGRSQVIEVGPMSGASNVVYWLMHRGIEPDEALTRDILAAAKSTDRVLEEKDIWAIVHAHAPK